MSNSDLICLSHLRWGFVFQRPNHLMSRCARARRVYFVEEPVHGDGPAHMQMAEVQPNLWVCTPHIQHCTPSESESLQRSLLGELLSDRAIEKPILWFYTPMALAMAAEIDAALVVYDCMDELSAFRGAPPELVEREQRLFERSDLVFTGGQSLFEAKRSQHPAIHAFPSSVDAEHFLTARRASQDPPDQAAIPHPRLGFFGVIDERMDLTLLATLARSRPNYQIVMIGPVVKIARETLPHLPNIHYLGPKNYSELPAYIAGWQVALMPFALNESTRFISPTKTLEYLAAGKPVVSTAIRDVVSPYGEAGVVRVADDGAFAAAVDAALATDLADYLPICDQIVQRTSWDKTWSQMLELITGSVERTARASEPQKGNHSCSTI